MQQVNNERRIVGKFIKQVWAGRKGDVAIPIATVTFDATRAVLSRDIEFIRSLRDGDETSDEIGRECVAWDGPCEVYMTAAVVKFFGLDGDEDLDLLGLLGDNLEFFGLNGDEVAALLIEQVTQEMLDQARADYGSLTPDIAVLELRLKVSYSLNGEKPEMLQGYLHMMAERAIGNGMLTGYSDAEVEEHRMDVIVVPAETVIEEVRHEA